MKSTVAKVTYKKEFTTANGTMHSWHVTMDNGDMGETVTKTADEPWAVGEEAEYTKEDKEYNGQIYVKLKKAFAQGGGFKGGGGKAWTPDPEKENRKERWAKQIMITRQACLNTATAMVVAAKTEATMAEIMKLADGLETWVKRGIDLKSLVAAPVAPPAPAPLAKPTPSPARPAQPAHIEDAPGTWDSDEAPF